jgi:hypothetical protein
MSYSEDAKEHVSHIDWDAMTIDEQREVANWVKWVSEYDRNTERTGVSVPAVCATDLGINLDGELKYA